MSDQDQDNNPLLDAANDDDKTDHNRIAQEYLGENTPTKRSSTSGVWKDVKRLKMQLPNNNNKNFTHVCTVALPPAEDGTPRFCNQMMRLHKNKPKTVGGTPSWLSTKAGDHLRICHPVDSEAGAEGVRRGAEKSKVALQTAMAYGMPNIEGNDIDSMAKFSLSKRERSLSAQAQWYVYSSMHISKSEFDSIWFKNMLKEVGDGEKTALLTQGNLKEFLKAEWALFLMFVKLIINIKRKEAEGNAFAQALHDGGTLTNKKKFQALALQFIAPKWQRNIVLTLALTKSLHNKDTDVAEMWEQTMLQRTGFEFHKIVSRMRSDRAAKGVAGQLDMGEEEVCEMHDTDKLGRSALGGLVRSRAKTPINPFPEGVALVAKAHKLGAYFGYSTRAGDLSAVGKGLGNCPDITIKTDYNTTRIAAVWGLLHSEIRLNRALKAYEVKYSPSWEFTSSDWTTVAEFEAILNCTKITSTLAQIEKYYMAAYTILIKVDSPARPSFQPVLLWRSIDIPAP
ncbi:hypothetical protein AB1Y20_010514 [Prymnesium parvum]|uniref:Uncharacterized protein n=1 Tax=Prymnesium parvum TaxID=97485 RepID=A0AB34IRL6_PRYPA